MVVSKRGRPAAASKTTSRRSAASKPASNARRGSTAGRGKTAASKPERDVTQYADKEPTPYHKAFANWVLKEVGFDPNSAPSKRAAFLAGISIATAARPAFNSSDFLAEWRERTGEVKRGPKPKGTREEAADEDFDSDVEDSDEEFDEDEEEFDEDEDSEESDEEFDDDSEDEEESDEDDEEDFDEEPEPPKSTRRRAAPARSRGSRAAKPATSGKPAARGTRSRSTKSKDDDFLF